MGSYLSTEPMLKRTMYRPIGGYIKHRHCLGSERPLTLLVAPIAFVQAPGYLLADRGIGCRRDNDAVLGDDLAASGLDREVFGSERQVPVGPVQTLACFGQSLKKLNAT